MKTHGIRSLASLGFIVALLHLTSCVQTVARTNSTKPPTLTKKCSVDTAAMLAAHNAWRAKVGVQPLQWSDSLVDVAQQWADQLATTTCHPIHNRTQYGENIYWGSAVSWSDGRTEASVTFPKDVVKSWGDEDKYYSYATNRCHGVCGHYTQLVWKDTKQVGCGMAVCGNKQQIWVCNYYPAGNAVGKRPY
jgi:pathogenesis-related protein 1